MSIAKMVETIKLNVFRTKMAKMPAQNHLSFKLSQYLPQLRQRTPENLITIPTTLAD